MIEGVNPKPSSIKTMCVSTLVDELLLLADDDDGALSMCVVDDFGSIISAQVFL